MVSAWVGTPGLLEPKKIRWLAFEWRFNSNVVGSMYGIYIYIWLIFMRNVGKYTIHGSYGIYVSINKYLVGGFNPSEQNMLVKLGENLPQVSG